MSGTGGVLGSGSGTGGGAGGALAAGPGPASRSGGTNASATGGSGVGIGGKGALLDAGAGGTVDAGVAGGGADAATRPAVPAGSYLLFPAADAQGVCPDPPLRVTFSGPPTLGNSGKIQVFDANGGPNAVAAVDLGATSFSDTVAGTKLNVTRPAYVDGNDAVIYLPTHALGYGHTYYVTVDGQAIDGPTTTPFMISGPTTWRFSTASAGPANPSTLTVALDGTGDFCTLQAALETVPASGPARIDLRRGTYHEIVRATGKHDLTLHGEDRKATVIAGTNNNSLNPSTAARALVGFDASTGLTIENLTIHNLTPQGGSQAEALRLQTCERCAVRDTDIVSLQDTLLWSGHIYAKNCYVEGNVDFVWGTGSAYFDGCEIKTAVRSGYVVQARNAAGGYGYVFVDSKLTSDPGIMGSTLARIDVSVYPGSQVAYLNCEIGDHISPAGWTVTGGAAPSALRFWEYQSKDPRGNPIDISKRVAGRQMTVDEAASLRDPKTALGGWQPP